MPRLDKAIVINRAGIEKKAVGKALRLMCPLVTCNGELGVAVSG